MKLTKDKLIKITKHRFKELGYKEVNDTITGAQGLYIKAIQNGFYLSLGLTISRYYESKFTASFYLSKSVIWGAVWGDIPENSYQRVGHFLTNRERVLLLDKRYTQEGVTDTWWDLNDENAIEYFFETVQITEKRFLDQPGLFDSILNSSDVKELEKLAKLVIDEVEISNDNDIFYYRFIPKKLIDHIPMEWFKAAERIITNQHSILNINTVKRLAADAYRQKLYSTSAPG